MATSPSTPVEKTPPHKPKVPLLHLKSFSADPGVNSPSCSTPRSNVSWMERSQSFIQSVNQQDLSPSYSYVLPSPFVLKLIQLISTIICTGCYSEGVNAIYNSTTSQMFPYFVCSAYLIITPVILISYILGHKMPELLIRIFNALGGILFMVAGIIAIQSWRSSQNDNNEEPKTRNFLLASGLLCILNSILYLLDAAWSIHSSLASEPEPEKRLIK